MVVSIPVNTIAMRLKACQKHKSYCLCVDSDRGYFRSIVKGKSVFSASKSGISYAFKSNCVIKQGHIFWPMHGARNISVSGKADARGCCQQQSAVLFRGLQCQGLPEQPKDFRRKSGEQMISSLINTKKDTHILFATVDFLGQAVSEKVCLILEPQCYSSLRTSEYPQRVIK